MEAWPSNFLQGPEIEQQLVSQCLDADAQRYFDECVSIAGLDIVSINDASSVGAGYHGSVGYQESESGWSVKDMPLSPRKNNFGRADERNVVFLQPLKVFCAKIEQNGKCIGKSSNFVTKAPMNEDGLVLPWLQWETKVDYAFQEQTGLKVCYRSDRLLLEFNENVYSLLADAEVANLLSSFQ